MKKRGERSIFEYSARENPTLKGGAISALVLVLIAAASLFVGGGSSKIDSSAAHREAGVVAEPPAEADKRPEIGFVPRSHREVVVFADGTLRPRWIGPRRSIGLCLDPPLTIDTSQWRMRFRFNGEPSRQAELEKPFRSAGTALCFGQHIHPATPSSESLEVCGDLVDAFSGRDIKLFCFEAAYEADDEPYLRLRRRASQLIAERARLGRREYVAKLDELAGEVVASGYPLLAVDLQLNAIDLLTADLQLEEARRRIDLMPEWLSLPETTAKAALALYQRARIERRAGRPRQAWELLARAEEKTRRSGSNKRLAITIEQAEILSGLEAGTEPRRRLSEALADTSWPSDRRIVPAAREMRGWLVLTDPDSDAAELDAVEADLQAAATETIVRHEREQANLWINQALLELRRGRDPLPLLEKARQRLHRIEPSPRGIALLGWTDVVAGLHALHQARPGIALENCAEVAGSRGNPRLAARAWSCLGRAYSDLGRPEDALDSFEQALWRHEMAADTDGELSGEPLGQLWPVAPGWRADDYYRTARAAVELGDAEYAWELLRAFDRGASIHSGAMAESACDRLDPAAYEHLRRQRQRRRRELLAQLAHTEPPFSTARERQIQPIRRSLLRALEELDRASLVGCDDEPRKAATPADLRAIPLDDEVLLLRRFAEGRVEVARRTPMTRADLRQRIQRLEEARERARLDDPDWRRLAAPLTTALLPDEPHGLAPLTRFALHGILQRVPLAALPVDFPSSEARWLHEVTIPILRPAGARESRHLHAGIIDSPLFIVDPSRNLPSAAAAAVLYARLFPQAEILRGTEADRMNTRRAIPAASFLHVDAHGWQEAAFPQLSGLEMSDGVMTVADFQDLDLPLAFANLSGCHTGKAVATGDSGRYGLAGALAARGAPLVIASDTAIQDRVLADFNRRLYRQIAAGHAPPEAFSSALRHIRKDYPASAWAGLRLIGTAPQGQSQISPDYGKDDEGVDDGTR